MSFEFNVIPQSGAALIAQATSSNPIVLTECLSSPVAAVSKEDLASKDRSFYSGKSGSIFSASATNNVARIIMSFDNAGLQTAQPIKSACVLGRLYNQSDSQAVILAAISDDNSQIIIPDESAPVVKIHVPVNISINQDDDVAVVGGEYVAPGDLDRLVSAHIPGNPFQGEPQTVYGPKTFKSSIVSDSGSMSAIEKTSGDFNTYFGGYFVNRYEMGGVTYDYYTSEFSINDGKDYHSLIVDSESSQIGVNRSFGLVSKYYDGSNDYKLAKIQNYIIGDLNQNTVDGAISLEASDQDGNTKSALTMRKDSVVIYTTNSNLDASNIYIDCHDSFYLRNYASQSNNLALKLSNEISGNYSIYTLEATKSASDTVFSIGRITNKIDHIYANNFHGKLDGEANSAIMDSMGNELFDSYRGVELTSGTTELTFSTSAADPAVIIALNNAVAAAVQGVQASGDSTYSRTGAVGLFAFGQTSQTEYIPGDTVPGSALYAACMLYDNATQSFSLSESSTPQSGTWRLLSRAIGTAGKRCLVLAVKVLV